MNETARNIVKENFKLVFIQSNPDESQKNRCNPNIDISLYA